MQGKKAVAIVEYFKNIKDPRIEGGKLHNLIDIIAIAIRAVICGADTWEDTRQQVISRLENPADTRMPSFEFLDRIAKAFNKRLVVSLE